MSLVYGSVCSGIEAASVAWEPLGWKPAWFSEIAPFPSAVLAHRFPGVPNLGNMEHIHEREEFTPIDLLVGGTPCQSFSVAGMRAGIADPRGNLMLVFLGLVSRARPRWVVWENVPGVLSSGRGRDFGAFLGGLGQLGYGWAYRVLDAEYFGVSQRRRRVFVVGYLGDARRSGAVLFERTSLQGNTGAGSEERNVSANEASVIAFHATQDPVSGLVTPALGTNMSVGILRESELRRLTPREWERLQGFPDDWTLVPYRGGNPARNEPRYRAVGNSMAVPVMRWIGQRIAAVDYQEQQLS